MKKHDDFDLVNLPVEAQDPEIKAEDFTLQQADKEIHEQKFQTKPTTFLKDSLKRFGKNKSSVVAAYILGALILLSIFVPIFDTNDVAHPADDNAYNYLQPKLFDTGSGFWDGTVKKDHVPVDTTDPDPANWWPDETYYRRDGIGGDYHVSQEEYTSSISTYGRSGYLVAGYYGTYGLKEASLESLYSNGIENPCVLDLDKYSLTLEIFDTVDEAKIRAYNTYDKEHSDKKHPAPDLPKEIMPENFTLGEVTLQFVYDYMDGDDLVTNYIDLTETKVVHNTGTSVEATDKEPIVISEVIKAATSQREFNNFHFALKVSRPEAITEDVSVCSLVRGLKITVGGSDIPTELKNYFEGGIVTKEVASRVYKKELPGISFTDAMEFMTREYEVKTAGVKFINTGYWTVSDIFTTVKAMHLGRCTFASFTYDSYQGAFGTRDGIYVSQDDLEYYRDMGWIDFAIHLVPDPLNPGKYKVSTDPSDPECFYCDPDSITSNCPVIKEFTVDQIFVYDSSQTYAVKCTVTYWRYLGLPEMPRYLFGTDQSGKDMFKYVFDGLKNSLILGFATFAVCFVFGLIWGAVSGYFGGTVDLVMERVTDILAGIPWIVLMTIIILKAGSTPLTFVIALCLTGWIGTASTTRTQFYRFRGREYVLASRTLGASDARLIGKHILPNAMGTIITGAVLMIPSVIFSEATLAYLNLGFRNLSSLGVILSDSQSELLNHPYLLLFPATVIALVMISFNLFGNGLRDAINPSLKGEEE